MSDFLYVRQQTIQRKKRLFLMILRVKQQFCFSYGFICFEHMIKTYINKPVVFVKTLILR